MIECPFHPTLNRVTVDSDFECTECDYGVHQDSQVASFGRVGTELLDDYAENYEKIAKEDLEAALYSVPFQRDMADYTFKMIGDLKGKEVAEIGIGKGELFERLFNAKPARLVGIDISRSFIENAAKRYNDRGANTSFAVGNVEFLPFSGAFDTVVATDILEHVLNLGNALHRISSSLRAGGKFYCRVPYCEALGQYSVYNGCDYEFAHLRSFDERNIRLQFEEVGLTVKRFHKFGYVKARWKSFVPKFLAVLTKKRRENLLQSYSDKYGSFEAGEFNEEVTKHLFKKAYHQPMEILVIAEKD